ncbi:hypothetical protein SAMN04487783_2555 [Agrococcus baldri]|uniref:Uncharacterized protein n=1 Tax=Agrococcus baldri TaxID=153730 RepID=A0AA94HP92_9MICO|nr:hypothetical protein [Agrococcus baldri]SFS18173.1 hypothetical protein SAMN04487783_2555 [Agrococcus baldri]
MIAALNRLVELIEEDLTEELDVASLTARRRSGAGRVASLGHALAVR